MYPFRQANLLPGTCTQGWEPLLKRDMKWYINALYLFGKSNANNINSNIMVLQILYVFMRKTTSTLLLQSKIILCSTAYSQQMLLRCDVQWSWVQTHLYPGV